MKNNPRISNKERGLIKGALRRVFSRSDLRKAVIDKYRINHFDPNRPRATKWTWCAECGLIFPAYLSQVDHVTPIIALDQTLNDLTCDELVSAIWCIEDNLKVMDKECHKAKTKAENKIRRLNKKARG